jgi:hypothetical protein
MEPRIYTYKITFPDQGWWYWGVHRERKYGETYNGSPTTHSEKWKFFEFEKQILEFFQDWDEARKVEKRLILPDLNNPLCLNENSGGGFSLDASSKGGKNQSREDHVRAGKIGGKNGSRGDKVKAGKIGGKIGGKTGGRKNVESGQIKTIATFETRSKGGKKAVESGHLESIRTFESCSKGGKNGSREDKSRGGKISSSQKWRCLVTGYISGPGPLTLYQRARGIDTSLRKRVKTEGVV